MTAATNPVRRPKAVLIDLAGVLHVGNQAIDGAVAALARLRAAGLPLRFLTNTTRTPRRKIVEKLRRMGFDIDEDEVQTAAHAALQLVRERKLHPLYLVHPDLADEVGASATQPDAVVLGDMGPFLDYAQLNAAFRLLMAGKPFIAMAKNRYFMEEDGLSLAWAPSSSASNSAAARGPRSSASPRRPSSALRSPRSASRPTMRPSSATMCTTTSARRSMPGFPRSSCAPANIARATTRTPQSGPISSSTTSGRRSASCSPELVRDPLPRSRRRTHAGRLAYNAPL